MNHSRVSWGACVLAGVGLLVACGDAQGDDGLGDSADNDTDLGTGASATSGGSSASVGGSQNPSSGGSLNSGGTPSSGGVGTGGDDGSGGATSGGSDGSGGAATGGASGSGGAASGGTSSGGAPNCTIPTPSTTPIGYGKSTTGGGSTTAITVSTFAQAQAALDTYRTQFKNGTKTALVLRYNGTFNYASITDVCAQHTKDAQILEIKTMDNVTFEGTSGSSANFGIHINRAKNVIVRNMKMGLLPGGDASDAITVEGNGTNGDVENVWIDHNELFSSTKSDCAGAGDTEFDGLIDVKKGARYITISYNYLHDHQKTGLLGFSDTDDTDRYVTFHHNRYENVVSRTPLHRYGYVHLYNNYFGQILSSGINVRMGGVALIEANYFENAVNPVTSRYSDGVGFWDLRQNYVGSGITWTTESDTLANAENWTSTKTFPSGELTYSYTPDAAACVKAIVLATAGAKL